MAGQQYIGYGDPDKTEGVEWWWGRDYSCMTELITAGKAAGTTNSGQFFKGR